MSPLPDKEKPLRNFGGVLFIKGYPPCRVLPVLNLLSQVGVYWCRWPWPKPNAYYPRCGHPFLECWLKTWVRHHAHGRCAIYTMIENHCKGKATGTKYPIPVMLVRITVRFHPGQGVLASAHSHAHPRPRLAQNPAGIRVSQRLRVPAERPVLPQGAQ